MTQDLQRLTAWLSGFELNLVSKPGKGSIIEGTELAKRNAIAHITQLVSPQADKKSILHLFLPHEISTVKQALRDMQQSHRTRSEEHTSELQSRFDLVCRLLL